MKGTHCLLCGGIEDIAERYSRQGGEVAANAVQLLLNSADILPRRTTPQRPPGVGGYIFPNGRVKYDVDIAAVVVLQNGVGDVALLCQCHAAPLA